jgi:TonB family protein
VSTPAVYRVPRRLITFPDDPRPYGVLAVSFLGHMVCFGAALALSAFLGSGIDQSKVYIVNLVPATPSLGSPAPAAPAPAAPVAKAPEAPKPTPPAPKAEEKAPPRPAKPEPPPPAKSEPPPPRPPERVVEPPPPRAPEVAAARPKSLEPSELALPRRVEKENPALKASDTRVERSLPPPPPVALSTPASPVAPREAPRLPEPPRIAAPPAVPTSPPAPSAPVATARPGVDPIRLGKPNAPSTSTGSIAVDASDFPFTYYLRLIQSKIGERWSPPRAAAGGGERVVVLFEIQRDGQIREPTVERTSGNSLYDQSALRAVTEASPFPPLPPEFKASSLRVHFGFEFQPGQG